MGLGLDLRTFLFQGFNFAVLLIGLSYFLYKPLAKLLADRRQAVADAQAGAEKMARATLETEAARQMELERARLDAQKIIDEARVSAKNLALRLETEAKAQHEQLLDRARKEAGEEKERARRELREELVATIIDTTEKLLETELDGGAKTEHTRKLVTHL
jgi:F-type H+-transporting ATPase subunit b